MKTLRKHYGAILLLVGAIGLLSYLVYDRHHTTSAETLPRKHNLLPAWRVDEVNRVAFHTSDVDIVLTAKTAANDAKEWDVTAGGATFPADEQVVDKILGTLQYALWKREIPKGSVDRAAFGLDAPRETIEVTMGDVSMRLAIGGPAAIANETYAEVKDGGVYAISAELAASFVPSLDDLRSKNFVPYFSVDLKGLSLRGEGGDRDFERAKWGGGRGSGFRLAGGGVRVDSDTMDRVFVAFGKMQAAAFLDDKDAEKASTARITLTLTPKQGAKAVIVLGGPCPTKKNAIIAIRKEPSLLSACVPDVVMDALSQPLGAFEDKHVVGANIDELVELEVQDGDKKLDIARSGSGFKMRVPVDKMVSGDRGNALLSDLLLVKGDLAPDDAPLDGTPIEVTVHSAGGVAPDSSEVERTEVIDIYPAKPDKDQPELVRSTVLRKEDGRKLLVSASLLHAYAANDLLVRDLTVMKELADDVTGLTIEAPGRKQVVKRADRAFELVLPKGKGLTADAGFTADLTNAVAHIETTRWIAEKDDGTFGLGSPRLSITADLAAKGDKPARSVHLLIGARTDEGSYARIDTDPAVFLAPRLIETDAARWLVSRSAFIVSTESIDKLMLTAGADKLELVRDGKQLKVKGKTDDHANQTAAAVAQALDALMPLAAVSVGPPQEYQGMKKPILKLVATQGSTEVHIDIGAGDTFETTAIHYARRDDIDATYALSEAEVRKLTDAVAGR